MIIEAILIGLIFVKIFGGKYKRLLNFNLRGINFLFSGIILNIMVNICSSYNFGFITEFIINYYVFFHIATLLLLIIGLMKNYDNKGIILMNFGLILNLIPIVLNGKMPVSVSALQKTGNLEMLKIISQGRSLSHGVFNNPKVFFLSDIIALKPPYIYPKVISIGDIIISLGLIVTILLISRSET